MESPNCRWSSAPPGCRDRADARGFARPASRFWRRFPFLLMALAPWHGTAKDARRFATLIRGRRLRSKRRTYLPGERSAEALRPEDGHSVCASLCLADSIRLSSVELKAYVVAIVRSIAIRRFTGDLSGTDHGFRQSVIYMGIEAGQRELDSHDGDLAAAREQNLPTGRSCLAGEPGLEGGEVETREFYVELGKPRIIGESTICDPRFDRLRNLQIKPVEPFQGRRRPYKCCGRSVGSGERPQWIVVRPVQWRGA